MYADEAVVVVKPEESWGDGGRAADVQPDVVADDLLRCRAARAVEPHPQLPLLLSLPMPAAHAGTGDERHGRDRDEEHHHRRQWHGGRHHDRSPASAATLESEL